MYALSNLCEAGVDTQTYVKIKLMFVHACIASMEAGVDKQKYEKSTCIASIVSIIYLITFILIFRILNTIEEVC